MAKNVSRRSVAKGALWATPAVAVAASAPALAASGAATVASTVCNLFYGTGTASYQAHNIYFSFTSSTATIPAGTVVTNQVCVTPANGGTWNIPTNTYPVGNGQTWNITYTDASGNPLSAGTQVTGKQCFNVLYTFTGDTDPAKLGCVTGIIWSDTATIPPASTITVSTDSAVTGATNGGAGTLAYTVAERAPQSVNSIGRSPHTFTSKSGLQNCYPSVSSSQGMTSDGADDVACYPSGTNITTARCSWTNGKTCAASTTGLCTPPFKNAVSGETDIPSMC